MLELYVPSREVWDERKEEILNFKGQKLTLEHSLISIANWESKWKKPFMTRVPKTNEETLDYIRFMTLTKNVDPLTYYCLTADNATSIQNYIKDPMSATKINEKKHSNDIITSEYIYYLMITLNIPIQFEKWHINRLMALISLINEENKPKKKMSTRDILSRNSAINAMNRKRFNTRG